MNGLMQINFHQTLKYSLFYKPSKTNDLTLLPPKLLINDNKAERVGSIKFLGILLDEHLSWKEHIRYTKNEVAKSKTKDVLIDRVEHEYFF